MKTLLEGNTSDTKILHQVKTWSSLNDQIKFAQE
jgi:hypothetical protein